MVRDAYLVGVAEGMYYYARIVAISRPKIMYVADVDENWEVWNA